jgi:hypothetical protein
VSADITMVWGKSALNRLSSLSRNARRCYPGPVAAPETVTGSEAEKKVEDDAAGDGKRSD